MLDKNCGSSMVINHNISMFIGLSTDCYIYLCITTCRQQRHVRNSLCCRNFRDVIEDGDLLRIHHGGVGNVQIRIYSCSMCSDIPVSIGRVN